MKISTENSIHRYDNISYKFKAQSLAAGMKPVSKDRDQVIIGSGKFQIEEKRIAEEAVRSISVEVRTPTSQDKIESLKQRVREGTYRPDPEEIVSRMLLEKGPEIA